MELNDNELVITKFEYKRLTEVERELYNIKADLSSQDFRIREIQTKHPQKALLITLDGLRCLDIVPSGNMIRVRRPCRNTKLNYVFNVESLSTSESVKNREYEFVGYEGFRDRMPVYQEI